MSKELQELRALSCYKNNFFSFQYEKGEVTYLLFEVPIEGHQLSNLCKKENNEWHICKYSAKDFIKSFISAVKYTHTTDDKDINVFPTQNGVWYGQLPKYTFDEKTKNSIADPTEEKHEEDTKNNFITVPFFKYFSPDNISKPEKLDDNMKKMKEKQFMVYFGEFMINMYKGFDRSTDMTPPNMDDRSDAKGLQLEKLTDLFKKMNEKVEEIYEDSYFGVGSEYVVKVKDYENNTLTSHNAIEDMDKLLTDSYYGFLANLVQYDMESKRQFGTLDDAMKHKFVTEKVDMIKTRSDTS